MYQRVLLYGGVLAVLIAFAFIMGAGVTDADPLRQEVTFSLDDLYHDLEAENWKSASASWQELEEAWSLASARLTFIEERLPLFQFELDMFRLKGSILARDKSAALQTILAMRSIWDGF